MATIQIGTNLNIKQISPIKDKLTESIVQLGNENKDDFKEAFLSIINNAEKSEAVTKEDAYKLSIGQVDDLHTMMINSAKADIALQTMVQLRNKVLEAYSEVMRINL